MGIYVYFKCIQLHTLALSNVFPITDSNKFLINSNHSKSAFFSQNYLLEISIINRRGIFLGIEYSETWDFATSVFLINEQERKQCTPGVVPTITQLAYGLITNELTTWSSCLMALLHCHSQCSVSSVRSVVIPFSERIHTFIESILCIGTSCPWPSECL